MKKTLVLVFLTFVLLLTGCTTPPPSQPIKEYTGTKIAKLTYITSAYDGFGYTKERLFDFNENQYLTAGYRLDEEKEFTLKKTFTDAEEKIFMDACYSYGLFDLAERYEPQEIVYDGYGWSMLIEYEDGTVKKSVGSNASPKEIFDKCCTYFYDLCGEVVVGLLPEYYVYPPNVSTNVGMYGYTDVVRADYKWNKGESLGNDLYSLNEANKDENEFKEDVDYTLVLYTSNYNCKEKFNGITIKEYDYNSELTNERVVYSGKWFKQIELALELNKIYVYELSFRDGDYVQYTFSTLCHQE